MHRRIIAALLLLCLFACCLASCRPSTPPVEEPPESDRSLDRLQSAMEITQTQGAALLELLSTLSLEGEVLFVYPTESAEGVSYYHLWVGTEAVDVYLDTTGAVAAIVHSGRLLFGEIPPPDPEAPPYPVTIALEDYTEAVALGGRARLLAHGTPGVTYLIRVYYTAGPSSAKGLEPQVAAEDGSLLWEWSISHQVSPGDYHIVLCREEDELDRLTLPLTVLPAPADPTTPPEEPPPLTPTLQAGDYTATVEVGATARVRATGRPGSEYGIKVYYAGGPSSAQGLTPQHADADGNLAWSFTVSANVAPGSYEIVLYRLDDERDAVTLPFTVSEKTVLPPEPEPPVIMTLRVEDYSTTCPAGQIAHVRAIGTPGLLYQIKVYYAGGPSTAQGLVPQIADSEGRLYWSWTVSANVAPGDYRIVLQRAEEEEDTLALPFTVTEKLSPPPEIEEPEEPLTPTLTLDTYTATVAQGEMGRVALLGQPGKTYHIEVIYAGGPSSAQGLDPQAADATGALLWSWTVSPNVAPGEYTIRVYRADDSRDVLTLPLTVTEKPVIPPAPEEPVTPTLTLSSHTATVASGENGCVSVVGRPGAAYRIRVYYSSGASSAAGLEDQTAAEDGTLCWLWTVARNVAPGTYEIRIYRIDDPRDTLTLPLEVTAPAAPPAQEEDPPALTLRLQAYTARIRAGELGKVHATGQPGVQYKIKVYYAGGASSAAGLEPIYAGPDGSLAWQWRVSESIRPGTYRIQISQAEEPLDCLNLTFEVIAP